MTALIHSIRSEAVRLRRTWTLPAAAFGLSALATVFAFSGDGIGPQRGSQTASPTDNAAALEAADGIVAGLEVAGTLIALIALVLWALSVSRDLQTGSIRVLLVTQARRSTYLGGKLLTLAITTVAMAVGAVAVSVGVAHLAAVGNDISTDAWTWTEVGSALVNTTTSAMLWGAIGGVLALASRSAAAAIAGGLGYMLLGENLLGSLWSSADDWLPAGTVDTLLAGGTTDVPYSRALALAIAYTLAAIAASLVVITNRDVTD